MAFVLKDGQGSMFRNDKQGNESRPDYRGELMIAGTLYRVSGWLKEGKKGKWMSLSAAPKEDRPQAATRSREPGEDDDFGAPF